MPEAVIYPGAITTGKEKLFACYSLIEQMRLERNSVSLSAKNRLTLVPVPQDHDEHKAKENQGFIRAWCPEGFMLADTPENNSLRAKFRIYAHETKVRQKQLLAEQNRLKENILRANYTPEQWKAVSDLPIEERRAINETLFGNKAEERIKTTKATSPLLDELKALNLDDMPEKLGSDPTEDFTTYTETDPGSDITKTADRITFTALQTRSDTFHVLYDKGVGNFDGDFEHLEKIYASLLTAGCVSFIWMLANMVGDFLEIDIANGDALGIYWYNTAGDYSLTLDELDGGTEYADGATGLSISTIYFLENERDEAVGTYGTAYSRIAEDDYYGEVGSTEIDIITVALHTSKKDFRYIYGLTGYDTDSADKTATGYVELLDLQETGPQTIEPGGLSSGETFGTLQANFGLTMSGLSSAEIFGTTLINFILPMTGLASAEAIGSHQLNLNLIMSAIASAEAIGSHQLNYRLIMTGIPSAEAIGSHEVKVLLIIIEPSSIASDEAIGSLTLSFVSEEFPTVMVRIAFVSDPFAASPTWTTLTGEVLSCDIKRGRQHALDRIEAGRAIIVIKNLTGNYWPDNSGGSHYGDILPIKAINIRATYAGSTYDLYTGFIESWKPSWLSASGLGPVMTLIAVDLFKNLAMLLLNDGSGYSEEKSGTRIGNVLNDLSWPAGKRDLDTGQSDMQASGALENVKAMEHLFDIAWSEAGIIFMAGDGDIQFQDRHARFKSPYLTSQATFGTGAGEMRYTDIDFSFDDEFIFNDVRIEREGGAEQVAEDVTSQTAYGKRGVSRPGLLMTSDGEALDQANYLLNNYKDARMRVNSIIIKAGNNPANLFPKVLSYDISDRITVNLSQASVDEDYHIEGIHHRFNAKTRQWETNWQLSPSDAQQYWLIGEAGFSEIGETTRVGY